MMAENEPNNAQPNSGNPPTGPHSGSPPTGPHSGSPPSGPHSGNPPTGPHSGGPLMAAAALGESTAKSARDNPLGLTVNVDTLLPENGPGFVTNNRGANGEFQFGQQSTIDATIAVAAAWDESHSQRPFSIGQISKKGGGPFPPHKSHRLGVDV